MNFRREGLIKFITIIFIDEPSISALNKEFYWQAILKYIFINFSIIKFYHCRVIGIIKYRKRPCIITRHKFLFYESFFIIKIIFFNGFRIIVIVSFYDSMRFFIFISIG